jgi:hypothetical protein
MAGHLDPEGDDQAYTLQDGLVGGALRTGARATWAPGTARMTELVMSWVET